MSRIASGRDGRAGIERITGETPTILEWLDVDIYDLVWIWGNPNAKENQRLARWLGVAHPIVGSDLCYWVLMEKGISWQEPLSSMSRTWIGSNREWRRESRPLMKP